MWHFIIHESNKIKLELNNIIIEQYIKICRLTLQPCIEDNAESSLHIIEKKS